MRWVGPVSPHSLGLAWPSSTPAPARLSAHPTLFHNWEIIFLLCFVYYRTNLHLRSVQFLLRFFSATLVSHRAGVFLCRALWHGRTLIPMSQGGPAANIKCRMVFDAMQFVATTQSRCVRIEIFHLHAFATSLPAQTHTDGNISELTTNFGFNFYYKL